jgi:nucleoside-diphosphate-sugar epimerase
MHIFITGAFGFVGTNLSRALSAGKKHRLPALDLKEPAGHLYDLFYTWDDLSRLESTPVDAIIHLAGNTHDTRNTAAEKEYFDINLGLTEKIFDFWIRNRPVQQISIHWLTLIRR